MDYNNGNNSNMNMGNPGMPYGGIPNQGMPNPGIPNQGIPNRGVPNQGIPNQGMPNRGMPNQGMPNPGIPNQGMPNRGMPNPGMPNHGMLNPGMPNQGMPNHGMPNQGMPNRGMPNPGMVNPNVRPPISASPGNVHPLPTRADIASNRLAREIEKSVGGDRKSEGQEGGLGLRQAGRSLRAGRAIAVPEGLIEGISGLSSYIFGGILIICLIVSLVAYGKGHKGGSVRTAKASIPTEMITYTGIFRNAYEAAAAGSLSGAGSDSGVLYNDDGTMVPAAPTAIGEETPAATDPDDFDPAAISSGDDETAGGSGSEGTDSASSGSYGQAESYKELLDQLEKAIASGDSSFVASKMAYEDESGTLKAFPQTVVDHFVTYMSSNTDKLSALMTDLSSDKYSGQNDGDFIVKLPYIKFVVNMGYDNTTVSIPGFNEQVVNAGQSADIAPLLPCMYTLTISNPDWNDVVTRDIEANINESTISINIKP